MKYDRGTIGTGPVVCKGVTLDAVILLYHHIREEIGVQRIQPEQALSPSTNKLPFFIEPFILRYCEHIEQPKKQVSAKLIGGEYQWNVYEFGYLLEKYQTSVMTNIMSFLELAGLRSVIYKPTEEKAEKTLTLQSHGLIEIVEKIPELNKKQAQFSYDQIARLFYR